MPIAFIYQRDTSPLYLATVRPTRENTYTDLSVRFVVAGLGFEWQASTPVWQSMYWAWRRRLDHRAARGKYLHRHKGRSRKQHALKAIRPLPKVSWAFGQRPPKTAEYVTYPLFLTAPGDLHATAS